MIAVGDGASDVSMFMEAGMGVAFCAKPKVLEGAEFCSNYRNLENLLFLMGLSNKVSQQIAKIEPVVLQSSSAFYSSYKSPV